MDLKKNINKIKLGNMDQKKNMIYRIKKNKKTKHNK